MDDRLALFDLLNDMSRSRYAEAERRFARMGMNHSEARILVLLNAADGEATQEHLASQMFIDRCNCSRALKRLEQEGMISRRKDTKDKRTNLVQLLDKGRDRLEPLAEMKREFVADLFHRLTDKDVSTLRRLLLRSTGE